MKTHPDYLIKIAKLINKHANIQDTFQKKKIKSFATMNHSFSNFKISIKKKIQSIPLFPTQPATKFQTKNYPYEFH